MWLASDAKRMYDVDFLCLGTEVGSSLSGFLLTLYDDFKGFCHDEYKVTNFMIFIFKINIADPIEAK